MALTKKQLSAIMPTNLARQINICPSAKIVYITNQKAACSTIKLFLQRIELNDPAHTTDKIHQDRTLPRPREFGWDNVCEWLSGGAFVFTFVRHPIERALSAYRDKFIGPGERRERYRMELQRRLGLKEDPHWPPTLDQFLDGLEISDPVEMDPHWRPQYINTLRPVLSYDFIGKVENFDADLELLKKQVYADDIPIVVCNSSAQRNQRGDSISVVNYQKQRLENIYAKDFEYFGY